MHNLVTNIYIIKFQNRAGLLRTGRVWNPDREHHDGRRETDPESLRRQVVPRIRRCDICSDSDQDDRSGRIVERGEPLDQRVPRRMFREGFSVGGNASAGVACEGDTIHTIGILLTIFYIMDILRIYCGQQSPNRTRTSLHKIQFKTRILIYSAAASVRTALDRESFKRVSKVSNLSNRNRLTTIQLGSAGSYDRQAAWHHR
jgi:hypothetical protein